MKKHVLSIAEGRAGQILTAQCQFNLRLFIVPVVQAPVDVIGLMDHAMISEI